MKVESLQYLQESDHAIEKAIENEINGKKCLSRLLLTMFYYSNLKLKLAAARHKETLLQRMNTEQMKGFVLQLMQMTLHQQQDAQSMPMEREKFCKLLQH